LNVSLNLIKEAIIFYENKKYTPTTVPMLVDTDVAEMTKPKDRSHIFHNDKTYVGSAENSFIQLWKEKKIQYGKYMGITPCFRDEPILDDLRLRIFLKIELIIIGSDRKEDLFNIIHDAQDFFKTIIELDTDVIKYDGIYDIECSGYELGSYDIRKMIDGTPYCCGTGIAEPRTSTILKFMKLI
jgi:seryl-tRNA synthetase